MCFNNIEQNYIIYTNAPRVIQLTFHSPYSSHRVDDLNAVFTFLKLFPETLLCTHVCGIVANLCTGMTPLCVAYIIMAK